MQRITDLTLAIPATAWTNADAGIDAPPVTPPAGGRRVIDYPAGGIRGRAVQTRCADSADLTIPPHRPGWQVVSLALAGNLDQEVIELRLGGQASSTRLFWIRLEAIASRYVDQSGHRSALEDFS